MNNSLSKFQQYALCSENLSQIKGGEETDKCKNSWSASEVQFLMDANEWSKQRAEEVLYLSCKYAAVAYKKK